MIEEKGKLIREIVHEKTTLRINVFDSQNKPIGCLIPLTLSAVGNDDIVQKLTRWRNLARNYFLTQFTATDERTRAWLENVILKDYSRLLFIINSTTKPIGCYGFKDLSAHSVELDNLIRGEMGGHAQLIYYTEAALIKWIFEIFKVERICALVLSSNAIVLNLHQSLGFKATRLIPLHKTEFNDEVHLKLGEPGGVSRDGLYAQKIELGYSDFVVSNG